MIITTGQDYYEAILERAESGGDGMKKKENSSGAIEDIYDHLHSDPTEVTHQIAECPKRIPQDKEKDSEIAQE